MACTRERGAGIVAACDGGGGPAVYFYLGETDSGAAFEDGIPIGGQLSRPYDGESLTLTLPAGQSLDVNGNTKWLLRCVGQIEGIASVLVEHKSDVERRCRV